MQIKLVRESMNTTSTEGKLYVDGKFECYTVEDTDRKLETAGCSAKVQDKTCIPRGTYNIIISYSNHFKKELIEVQKVPCYTGVRIHSGNSSKDSEGCIIVGSVNEKNTDDWVGGSKLAIDALQTKVAAALKAGQKVTLEIV